ncbi:MAG: hypothetical protein KGI30_05515 [Planctomycetota bacterium]|nr:hypothetical protein [Planctomycetota bacterium]
MQYHQPRFHCELEQKDTNVFYDPLYIANEGKVVIVASADDAIKVRDILKEYDLGKDAEIIGEVIGESPGNVCLKIVIGGTRVMDMLVGDQLPRIC